MIWTRVAMTVTTRVRRHLLSETKELKMYRRDGLTDTQALEGCEKWAKGHRMIPVLEPRND